MEDKTNYNAKFNKFKNKNLRENLILLCGYYNYVVITGYILVGEYSKNVFNLLIKNLQNPI